MVTIRYINGEKYTLRAVDNKSSIRAEKSLYKRLKPGTNVRVIKKGSSYYLYTNDAGKNALLIKGGMDKLRKYDWVAE